MPRIDLDALRRTPAYPFVEAAHYLRLPKSTLRSWFLGQAGFRSLIRLDSKTPSEGLSFINLVEAHVLAGIRRIHGVPLPKVRKSLAYVANHLDVQRHAAPQDVLVHKAQEQTVEHQADQGQAEQLVQHGADLPLIEQERVQPVRIAQHQIEDAAPRVIGQGGRRRRRQCSRWRRK